MTPTQFMKLSQEDKAYMIAHDRAYSDMQSYESYLQSKEMEKKSKRGGG